MYAWISCEIISFTSKCVLEFENLMNISKLFFAPHAVNKWWWQNIFNWWTVINHMCAKEHSTLSTTTVSLNISLCWSDAYAIRSQGSQLPRELTSENCRKFSPTNRRHHNWEPIHESSTLRVWLDHDARISQYSLIWK